MPQPKYNLHLKGNVGGYDFDRDYVDKVLARNESKPVYVLIDSLGLQTSWPCHRPLRCHECQNRSHRRNCER